MPGIVAFTGHMIDRPGRPAPRFPGNAEQRVARRIARSLDELEAAYGYASAACGGDILFHEAMLQRGGQINVVLPCPTDEFREACIDIIPDGNWGDRFERVMDKASTVEILSDQCASDNAMASECCNRVILGLATMEAQKSSGAPSVLAFWDGRPGDAIGGTHSLVEFALAHNRPVRVIDALDIGKSRPTKQRGATLTTLNARPNPLRAAPDPAQQLGAMVFADVVHFSRLKERQLPHFARHYLGGLMRLLMGMEGFPLAKNTWGDGLYLVFSNVRDAGGTCPETLRLHPRHRLGGPSPAGGFQRADRGACRYRLSDT